MRPEKPVCQKEGFSTGKFVEGCIIIPNRGDEDAVILNETAGFIWRELEKPATFDELVERLRAEYGVSVTEAEADLEELFDIIAPYIREASVNDDK